MIARHRRDRRSVESNADHADALAVTLPTKVNGADGENVGRPVLRNDPSPDRPIDSFISHLGTYAAGYILFD